MSKLAAKPRKGSQRLKLPVSAPEQAVLASVNARLGRPVVMLATDPRFTLRRVPSGSLAVDRVTGGGFVRGRHVELYGDFSAGKSAIAYRAMALAQERGEVCALVDAEHVFDQAWFRHLGGDPDRLLAWWPSDAEECLQVLQLFADRDQATAGISLVTVDSVASLLPRELAVKDVTEGDDRVAALARFMSRLLPRVTTKNRDTLFLWTNQVRDQIGYFSGAKPSGGRALSFYATTRIEFAAGEKEMQETKVMRGGKEKPVKLPVGRWTHVKSRKDKSTSPFREGQFYFDFRTKSIDTVREAIDLGLQDGLVKLDTRSHVYSYEDHSARGYLSFLSLLRENPSVVDELTEIITENSRDLGES